MVRLYLDLETYRPRKEGSFVEEKVIASGLLIDETPYQEDSLKESVDPILLTEWSGLDECGIVGKLQDQVKTSMMNHRFTVICGFNILMFDVPLLICRCVQHSLAKLDEVSKMWNDSLIIDYSQQLLVANMNLFKGTSLPRIVEVSEKLGLNPPAHSHGGNAVKDLYDQGKYAMIEEHLKQDLNVLRWIDLYGARRLIETSMKTGQALFKE
jgi:hypothetical protein